MFSVNPAVIGRYAPRTSLVTRTEVRVIVGSFQVFRRLRMGDGLGVLIEEDRPSARHADVCFHLALVARRITGTSDEP